MRVVLVDPSAQVPYYTRALAGALAENGVAATLATAPDLYYDPGPPPAGVRLEHCFGRLVTREVADRLGLAAHPLLRRLLRAVGYGPEVASFVRRVRRGATDVVHVQWSLAPLVDALAVRRIRSFGTPVIYTAHNVLPHNARWWHAPGYGRLYRSVDRVIVHSSAAAERMEALAVPSKCIKVIPMAADEVAHPDRRKARSAARRRLNLADSDRVVLFFGQVRPYKGLAVLVAAMARVAERAPDARLLVAGPVAGGMTGARRIAGSIDKAGLSSVVDFRPGYVASREVPDYFAASDVVALPYIDTDDSAVLAAARAHATAVVASSVGGIPEALASGGGLLVPPREPSALAEALLEVLLEPRVRENLESEARGGAASWTWHDAAVETMTLYERAVEAAR